MRWPLLYLLLRHADALAASYEWPEFIDLVTIRDFARVTAARLPKHATVDVFAPDTVVWAYQGPPQWTLRALLNLVHAAHPDAPATAYPAPPALHIPRSEQRPMTIRAPSALHAGVRATRLAIGLPVGNEPSTAARAAHWWPR